jgi:hypothetical protein
VIIKRGVPYLGLGEEGEILFYQALFIRNSRRDVKEGSRSGCLHRGPNGEPGGGLVTRDFDRQMK